MKRVFFASLALLLASTMSFVSCSKDSSDAVSCASGFNIYLVISDETQELSNALIAYSANPSQANCDAYKNALSAYIEALRSYEKCAREAGQLDDYQDSLDDALEDIDDIEC